MSETAQHTILPMFSAALKMQQRYHELLQKAMLTPFEIWNQPNLAAGVANPQKMPVRVHRGSNNEEIIGLGEETIEVGKEIVNGDTTRVIRTVVETPVEEAVELFTETVVVERRAPLSSGGINDVLSERVVHMTSTSERPVVSKSFRLVEEVVLRKQMTSHIELVAGTVRKDHVAVEQPNRLPAVIKKTDDNTEAAAQSAG